jgi:BRCT domain type II-containing protein
MLSLTLYKQYRGSKVEDTPGDWKHATPVLPRGLAHTIKRSSTATDDTASTTAGTSTALKGTSSLLDEVSQATCTVYMYILC